MKNTNIHYLDNKLLDNDNELIDKCGNPLPFHKTLSINMKYNIHLLIKLGGEKHMRDLYENGTIYINTVDFFRKEKDRYRGDSYEGASEIINSNNVDLKFPGIEEKIKAQSFHLKSSPKTVYGNIYSLYCISSKEFPNLSDFFFDDRMLEFGTHCVIFTDITYLLRAVEEELKKRGLEPIWGLVDYYDSKADSKKPNVFEKRIEFEYQKEFRLYVHNPNPEPIKIELGSLKGKAELLKSCMLRHLELKKIDTNNSYKPEFD